MVQRVEVTSTRNEIHKLLEASAISNPEGGYDPLMGMDGISLYEMRNWENDAYFKCVQYIFWTIFREYWAFPVEMMAKSIEYLWVDSIHFLEKRCYVVELNPKPGDIIAYRRSDRPKQLLHFGVLLNDGRIRSKFGSHNIYTHDRELVPVVYGNENIYLRKFTFPKT